MRRRDWVSVGFGGTAAAVAVLVAGSAFRWTQGLVALLLAAAVAAQIASRRALGRTSALVAVPATAALLTAISLIPVPRALREMLDPVGESYRADGVALLELSPWGSLTRDAPASLRALAFFLILLAVAALSLRIAASERGRFRLLATVASLSGAAAIVTLVHQLFGATRLYGVYEPRATPTILGPLLNENHLGALMAIGACVAGGLLMHRRQSSLKRALWALVLLLCAGMTAASHSRGALLALVTGGLVVGGVLLAQRFAPSEARRRGAFATSSLPIAIVGICVVVLVIYSSAGKVTAEIGRTSLDEMSQPRSKFAAWRSAEALVRESPFIGVGRGGFEPSFTRVYPASGFVTFGYVENEYIQVVVDWGLVGAILLGATGLWFASTAIRRWRDGALAAGALGAMTATAAQSNVDFGVELLGLAVPITIVASTLAYVALREEPNTRRLKALRFLSAGHCTMLLASALVLSSGATRSISEDHELLKESPTAKNIRESLNRHPLDYFGFAVAANQANGAASVQLLNQALRLHPTHPGLHWKAAQLLVRSGHNEQAAIEYSLAIRTTDHPDRLLSEVTKAFPAALAALSIPSDLPAIDPIVRTLQESHREDVAVLWLARVLVAKPRDVHVCNTMYELSIAMKDLSAAEIASKSCGGLQPDHQTRTALANVLMQRNGFAEVIRLLSDVDTWQGLAAERANAWLLLCDAHTELLHWDDAARCLHRLDATGDLTPDRHEEITKRLETILERRESGSGSKKL